MQERSNDLIINQSFGSSRCTLDNATDHLHQGKKLQNNILFTSLNVKKNPRTKQSSL